MDTSEVFKNGGITIPNPNYNPKNKKHKGEPYIFTNNVGKYSNPQAEAVASSAEDNWVMDEDYTRKYQRYGITPNRISPNLDKELADNQSNITKTFNALGQTLYSQAFLGTIKAFPDLFDLIGQKVFGIGDDYQNALSSKIQEWQDYFDNEVAPIYSDPTRNDILHGGLGNWGWWMSNAPSVASSLTLLIPSTGIVSGLKWLTGATKLGAASRWGIRAMTGLNKLKEGAELTKVQRLGSKLANSLKEGGKTSIFLENTANATLQRAMENYQEAQGVYKDMYSEAMDKFNNMSDSEYQNFINKNPETVKNAGSDDKETVAKYIAKESADRDFTVNLGNLTFDIIQMYGLRGFWKGLKDAHGSYNLNKALRNAKETIGKTPEQIAKAEKDASFWLKTKNNAIDMLKNEKVIIAGELSEGVEEAVNYVAQMEGMNLGRTLIDDKENTLAGAWDDRLKRYAKDGGLWDSAFWGVLGGVVFHHAGSGFRRIQATINEKNNKEEETNDKTGESKARSPFSLAETSETKARKSNIDSWVQSFNNFLDKAAKINNGENPYSESEADKTLASNTEKEIAREKAEEELFTEMTLKAAHNGNLGFLKELVKSDEIRQVLVDKGLTTEEASRDYQRRMLDRMEKVQEDYETEIEKLYNIANNFTVGKNKDDVVPFEYLQILATDNVRNKYAIDRLNQSINFTESLINSALQDEEVRKIFGDYFTDEEIKQYMRDEVLTQNLGELYRQRNEITKDVEHKNDITSLIAVDNINKNIRAISELLSPSALRKGTLISLNAYNETTEKDGKKVTTLKTDLSGEAKVLKDILDMNINDIEGNVVESKQSEQIRKLDEYVAKHGITGRFTETIEGLTIADTDRQNEQKRRAILSNLAKADEHGISGTTKKLSDLLIDITVSQANRDFYKNKIVNNKTNLGDEISFLNQTMNEGRAKVISAANKTIRDIIKNHSENEDERNSLIDSISAAYNQDSEQFDRLISFLDDTEKSDFKDAIDNLNLASKLNYRLGQAIQDEYRLIDWVKTKVDDNEPVDDEVKAEPENNSKEESKNENKGESKAKSQETGKQETKSKPEEAKSKSPNNQSPTTPKAEKSTKKSFKINLGGHINDSNGGYLNLKSNTISEEVTDADYVIYPNNDIAAARNDYFMYPVSVDGKTNNDFVIGTEKTLDNDAKIIRPARIKIDNDGSYKVVEPALIDVPTDKNRQSSEDAEQVYKDVNDEKERVKAEREAKSNPSNSSTGGLNNGQSVNLAPAPTINPTPTTTPAPSQPEVTAKPEPTPTAQPENNVSAEPEVKSKELSNNDEADIRTSIANLWKNNNYNKEEIDKIRKDYINRGYDENSINKLVNSTINIINKKNVKLGKPEVEKFQSSVIELYFATNNYNVDEKAGKSAFIETAKSFLTNYADATNLPQLNGKSYGTYEDLLRYVNELFPDSDVSEFIYNSLLAYLKTNDAKSRFVIVDEADADSGEALKNANKTIAERNAEREIDGTTRNFSLKLDNLGFSEKLIKAAEESLNNLKPGDKLNLEVSEKDNGTKILLIKSKDGTVIGYMGIPNVDPSNGSYIQVNDGVRYVVGQDENDGHDGNLKQFLKNVITATDGDYSEFNAVIHELAFEKDADGNPKEVTKELLAKLNKNKAFIDFVDNYVEYDNDGYNKVRALNHLAKLWGYCYKYKELSTNDNIIIRNEANKQMANSIDLFFNKLRKSYSDTNALVNAENANIEVDRISKGQLIRSVNFDFGLNNPEYSANPINDVLNRDEITDFELYASDGQNPLGIGSYKNAFGYTRLIINRENGTRDIVACYPVAFANQKFSAVKNGSKTKADVNYGADYTALRDCIIKQLNSYISNVYKNNTVNPTELVDFLDKVLNLRNSSMFIGAGRVIRKGNALYINLSGNSSIAIFTSSSNGSPQVRFNNIEGYKDRYNWTNEDDRKVIQKAILDFVNNSKVNLNFSLLRSDAAKDIPLGANSMFSRNADGKFVIDIPKYGNVDGVHFEYDSFKDFIVDNNLVRVDLGKNANGSNFSRLDITKPGANPTASFKISTNDDNTRPVEGTTESEPKPTSIDFKQEIQRITNDDAIKDEDKGFEIAKLLYVEPANRKKGSKVINDLKKGQVIDKILNHRVIFDQTQFTGKDKAAHALYSRVDKTIYLGDKFIDIINNKVTNRHDGRNLALRIIFHENIHAQLDELRNSDKVEDRAKHDRLVKQMKEIYNDFLNAYNQDVESANNGNFDTLRNRECFKGMTDEGIKKFIESIDRFVKFSPDSTKFEEFITESFTNTNLIDYFNSVDIKDDTKLGNGRNLWQQLLKFIGDLFDIIIRPGSLREKQLKRLGNIFIDNEGGANNSETNVNTNVTEEENKKEQKEENKEEKEETLVPVNEDKTKAEEPDDNLGDGFSSTTGKWTDLNEDDIDNLDSSTIEEDFNTYRSFSSAITALPQSERANFIDLVNSGEISVSCR